jgi:hypothetical protein
VDSDLADSISALKEAFNQGNPSPTFAEGDADVVQALRATLKLPRRYREFLLAANPLNVETATPSERIRLR